MIKLLRAVFLNSDGNQSGALYAKLASILSIFSQKKILNRIEGDWELTEPFLLALTNSQATISALVSESDKREKVRSIYDSC